MDKYMNITWNLNFLRRDNLALLKEKKRLEQEINKLNNKVIDLESSLNLKNSPAMDNFTQFKRCMLIVKRIYEVKEIKIDGRDFDRFIYDVYKYTDFCDCSRLNATKESILGCDNVTLFGINIKRDWK